MRRRGEGGRAKGEGLIFLDHKEPTGGRGGRREVGDDFQKVTWSKIMSNVESNKDFGFYFE